MKKIIITVAMLFGVATTNIANEVSLSDRYNTEIKTTRNSQFINTEQFGEYMDLTKTDSVLVRKIYGDFCQNLTTSLNIEEEKKRDKAAVKTVRNTILKMRAKLDDYNYRMFLRELHMSLYNNGLLYISDKYCAKYGK